MDKIKIGRRLTDARGSMTQREAAEKIGIGRSALAMYEAGHRIPKDDVKIRIAKVYEQSVQALFFD